MPLGNADLKAKICAVQAKYCLLILCVLHVLVFLIVVGTITYIYFTYEHAKPAFWALAAPGGLALFTGLGALMFLCVRSQLVMIICILWPILMFLSSALVYGVLIGMFASEGLEWKSADGKSTIRLEAPHVVAMFVGALLIPLSCICCCVLGCLGCIIKTDNGSGGQSNPNNNQESKKLMNNGNGGMDQNQGNMNQQYQNQGTPQQTPQRTPDRTPDKALQKDHSGHLY